MAARVGNRPFLPKLPFVPGYSLIGEVDAARPDAGFAVGDRVAALTVTGAHAEYVSLPSEQLAPVPADVDPIAAAPLVLNYLVAYQALHRVARVHHGDAILVIGASGGVGTAFMQLGARAGLCVYGLASPSKHDALRAMGARPIDYHQDWVAALRRERPAGVDFVFNGMAEDYFESGLAALRRGGVLVHYGAPQSRRRLVWLIGKLAAYQLLPNGKSIRAYGTHRIGLAAMKADWATLFAMLARGWLAPVIAGTYPLRAAADAYAQLERGGVFGALVLVGPSLSGAE